MADAALAAFRRAGARDSLRCRIACPGLESLRLDPFENLTPELQGSATGRRRLLSSAAGVIKLVIGDEAAAVPEGTQVIAGRDHRMFVHRLVMLWPIAAALPAPTHRSVSTALGLSCGDDRSLDSLQDYSIF
jgi:hypothetical protein